ncbi:DUF4012 domain-containing protein [Patescibacteria group bacterium]|nr:DUF4012 domain-containing protein [Patescibacteria group bacterium]
MSPAAKITVETNESAPLAVVYNTGDLSLAVRRALKKQHLRVLHLENEATPLPVLEHPAYIFFFISDQVPLANAKLQFQEAVSSAGANGAKVVLILDNVQNFYEKVLASQAEKLGWPLSLAEVHGEMDGPAGPTTEAAAGKIVRLAFSSGAGHRQMIMGKNKGTPVQSNFPERHLSAQDVFDRLNKFNRRRPPPLKKYATITLVLALFFGILSPLFLMGAVSLKAVFELSQAKEMLITGRFTPAESLATQAKQDLVYSQNIARFFGPLLIGFSGPMNRYYDLLSVGETGADVAARAARLGPLADLAAKSFLNGGQNLSALSSQIQDETGPLNQDLGLIEAQVGGLSPASLGLLSFMGVPAGKIKTYAGEIPRVRQLLTQADLVLSAWPQIVPAEGKKTYLVVFQNSAELRPTGGFIGSYGLVRFNNGKLLDWKIYDIYTADGKLAGTITPPDEILQFMGQPDWYMRDSNWAADFPLTAKRLEWFLEKETGETADGVIAVNLGAVQKLLEATGPLNLPDFDQTVSASDFFQKAEYSSEINFFAGSSQKQDFLGGVARAILSKLTTDDDKNYPAIANALVASLNEKNILLYFNGTEAQKAVFGAGWSGSIVTPDCQKKGSNCLMLVEANLGANKANYFVKRSLRVDSTVSKGGDIENTVTVLYRNDSPSDTWPGGKYKNYLRFLVPAGSKLISFDLGDGRKPAVSPTLTAEELSKVAPDEFFVFQTTENNYASFGTLVEIPIESDQTVTFRYRLPDKLSFANTKTTYEFHLLKQPGTSGDLFDFSLDYPSFLSPVQKNLASTVPLVFNQKLIYNSDLTQDRDFEVNFETKL